MTDVFVESAPSIRRSGPSLAYILRLPSFTGLPIIGPPSSATSNREAVRARIQSIPTPAPLPDGSVIKPVGVPTPATAVGEAGVPYSVMAVTSVAENVMSRFTVLDPTASAVWPGATIQGGTLQSNLV